MTTEPIPTTTQTSTQTTDASTQATGHDPIPVNIENEATGQQQQSTDTNSKSKTWVEDMEIAGGQLVEKVKELIAEGNVRRVIIRTQDNKTMIEIPLTAGVVVGGVVTLAAPLLAALGALAALIAKVKIQIVRTDTPIDGDSTDL